MLQLLESSFRFQITSLTVLCCWLLVAGETLSQQPQVTDLKKPVAMTMHRGTGYAFVVEKLADQLTRWDGEKVTPVVSTLSKKPSQLNTIVGATFRDRNCVTLLGYTEDNAATSRVVTYRISADGNLTLDSGLTSDLLLGEDSQAISAVTSTDLAIFFATTDQKPQTETSRSKTRLWQLPTGKASLGKPRVIRTIDGDITALTMNVQGHLVAAVRRLSGDMAIQFVQVTTGQPLVQIASDMQTITSLGFEPETHALYAAGTQDNRQGIYRMDVSFDGTKQLVRGTLAAAIPAAKTIVFSEQRTLVMVADGDSGRLVDVKFD